MTTSLSPQQAQAAYLIWEWFQAGPSRHFRLDGYAGTGKTTIAREVVDALGVSAVFAAFTGKAAQVLRSKGADPATTLHSLIYVPMTDLEESIRDLQVAREMASTQAERDRLQREINDLVRRKAAPGFTLREELRIRAPLVVVDESSMVSRSLGADLASFGVPILALGDPAQLEPVGDAPYFQGPADFTLTEIHRQAAGSPVLTAATAVRQARHMAELTEAPRVLRTSRAGFHDHDQIIAGLNRTRWSIIQRARRGDLPAPGERVVVLANRPDEDLWNGSQLTVTEPVTMSGPLHCWLIGVDDEGREHQIRVPACGFRDHSGEEEAMNQARGENGSTVPVTYAHAITAHKAQGSQWGATLLVDDVRSMAYGKRAAARKAGRAAPESEILDSSRRWLYTAITRAEHHVSLVPSADAISY